MSLRNYILIFGFLITATVFGQSSKQKEADKLFYQFQYVEAAKAYKALIKNEVNVEENTRKLADAYNYMRDPVNAVIYYDDVVKQDNISPEYYFRYAQNLRGVRRYDESKKWLKKYKEAGIDSNVVNDILLTDTINKYTGLTVNNLRLVPYNSPNSDFGVFIRGGLTYFTSARIANRETSDKIYGWNEQPFLDVYTAFKSRNNASFILKDEVRAVKGDVNTKLHDGPVTITANGKTMYFTRNNILGNREGNKDEDNTNNLKIYRASKKGDQWTNVVELPFNTDDFNTRTPSISPDGDVLYFSSDRPGGYGGSDLYKVSIEGDSYSEPINLGEVINTERDESFPQIMPDNSLYFSSNGHKGYGLLDVFVGVIGADGSYIEVINLGEPINSNVDDFSFFLVEKDNKGFIASNRDGGVGSDDIYQFDLAQKPLICNTTVEGIVTDAANDRPISGATVRILNKDGEQIAFLVTDDNGYYASDIVSCKDEYTIEVKQIKYTPTNTMLFTNFDEGDHVVTKNIELNPIQDVEFLANLEIIYFDFDKYNIRPDAAVELDKLANLMKNVYPKMIIKIGSHTDKRGSDAYNDKLAVNRAQSTYKYLLEKGIEPERILAYKGFGENQPAIRCPNNDCNEVEHQLNRRSVFEIVRMR